jgi:phage terminase Nu1 subunit (DNA packaging protein)
MKRIIFITSLFVLSSIGMAAIAHAQMEKAKTEGAMAMPADMSRSALKTEMRKLWEDHIVYTRNYIISALADLGDADAVAGRLLKNQDDIGDAIKPYYGEEAGKKLSMLLRDHIMIAAEVVKAAKTGNDVDLTKAQAKWTANADEIAGFLSGANPYWMKKDMEEMLHKHLEYTTGEVVSRLKKDWAADIGYYDKGHKHMLMFADVLTMGIEKQFPDKFKK